MGRPHRNMYDFPVRVLGELSKFPAGRPLGRPLQRLTANSVYVAGDDVAVVAVVDELLEFFKRRPFQAFDVVHVDDQGVKGVAFFKAACPAVEAARSFGGQIQAFTDGEGFFSIVLQGLEFRYFNGQGNLLVHGRCMAGSDVAGNRASQAVFQVAPQGHDAAGQVGIGLGAVC